MAIWIPIQRTAFRDEHTQRSVRSHLPVNQSYNIRNDWYSVQCQDDEVCIGLLREVRYAGSEVAPTMLAPSRFRHDTCLTWYQTGNPYQMIQIGAYFVKTDHKVEAIEYRQIGIIDQMVSEIDIKSPTWPEFGAGMLPDHFMPQQRWVDGSLTSIENWICHYERSGRIMPIGPRFVNPSGAPAGVVYLLEAVGTDWVKFGKAAERTGLHRLRQSQLCSPYRLRQLGVWLAPDGDADTWERRLERELKTHARAKRWEWVCMPKEDAFNIAETMFSQVRSR